MPFSSLFNRKSSRKNNQSKDKLVEETKARKQNNNLGGTSTAPGMDVSCRDESEILLESLETLKAEGTASEVIKSAVEMSKTSFQSGGIQITSSADKRLSDDSYSGTKTDCESDVVQTNKDETHILNSQREEKSSENLNLQNEKLNIYHETALEHNDESVSEEGSCVDPDGMAYHENPSTEGITIPKLKNGNTTEECRVNDTSPLAEQYDTELDRCRNNGEIVGQNDTNEPLQENAVRKNADDLPRQQIPTERNSTDDFFQKKENFKIENEETEMAAETNGCQSNKKTSEISEFIVSQTTTPRTNESVESVSDFSESKNNYKEYKTNELVVEVMTSSESLKDFSTVPETDEPEAEGEVAKQINFSDYTSSISPTETTIKNEQREKNVSDSCENEMGESISSMHALPHDKPLSENEIITDLSVSDKTEQATEGSEGITDKTEGVVVEGEKTEDQTNLSNDKEQCRSIEETVKETHDGNEKNKTNSLEHEPEILPENLKQELELQAQTGHCDTNETLEGACPTSRSLNAGISEQNTVEASFPTGAEKVDTSWQNSTSASSPAKSGADSTGDEIEIQTTETGSQQAQPNSTCEEQPDVKQVDIEDTNPSTEISETSPGLTNAERSNFGTPSESRPEVEAVESTAPLEDSLESFPSECDEFLGGQRNLLAYEQHPTPSWKVGYLQVKLPVKSRGRGKLKVWRQRWVVIQMDEFVKDAKDPSLMINIYASECSNARRHSALFWCTVSASTTVIYRSQSRTHKYAFSVSAENDVILHLAADCETASQEWMAAIRNLLWPPSPVVQLEKVLHGSDFEISVIDNEFSFHAGLLGTYGNMKVTSNKLILSHPQTDHVIQEWYLNTLDKFQLLPQSKEEDAFKVVVMHTGQDSSTGSGQIILFCSDAVTMLQSIASTIHKLLQYRTTAGKDHNQKDLADLADWLSPLMSQAAVGEPVEDYYKVPRRQIRSLLDIPNFSFERPLGHEVAPTKPSMLTSATSASTFSQDSGISMATQPDDFLNCSVTSFTIGGRPVRDHTSSESSDAYSPPCSPEMPRKEQEAEAT